MIERVRYFQLYSTNSNFKIYFSQLAFYGQMMILVITCEIPIPGLLTVEFRIAGDKLFLGKYFAFIKDFQIVVHTEDPLANPNLGLPLYMQNFSN